MYFNFQPDLGSFVSAWIRVYCIQIEISHFSRKLKHSWKEAPLVHSVIYYNIGNVFFAKMYFWHFWVPMEDMLQAYLHYLLYKHFFEKACGSYISTNENHYWVNLKRPNIYLNCFIPPDEIANESCYLFIYYIKVNYTYHQPSV